MYDRETESLWVHVTGIAETGPRKGQKLKFFPSTVAIWKEWKALYPHTKVLPGYRRGGFMGTYTGVNDHEDLGLSVILQFNAKLYPFTTLERKPVVNDRFRGKDLLVVYSARTATATAWIRQLGGKSLRP